MSLLYPLQKHPNHSWRGSLLRAAKGDSDPDRSPAWGRLWKSVNSPFLGIHETLERAVLSLASVGILKAGGKG